MPLNFSAMFQGLAEGTGQFAKMQESREEQEKREAAQSARDQANQAFQENLKRFEVKTSHDTQVELEGMRTAAEGHRLDVETDWHKDTVDREKARDEATAKYQMRSLDIQAQSKASQEDERKANAEWRRQQTDAAAAAMTRGDANAAVSIAQKLEETPKNDYLRAQQNLDVLVKAGKGPGDQEYDDAQLGVRNAQKEVRNAEKVTLPIYEQARKAIGYGTQPAAGATGAPGAAPAPLVSPTGQATPTPTPAPAGAAVTPPTGLPSTGLPGLGGGPAAAPAASADPLAGLPPDQAAAVKGLVSKGQATQADALAWVKSDKATPDAIKRAAGMATTAGGAPPAPPTTQVQSFANPATGQANVPTPGLGVGPPPPGAAPAAAPPPPAAAPATQQAAVDPAQLDAMAAKLQTSEAGKAVMSTLARLNEAKSTVVSEKIRRTAEIQLQQMFPGQDVNALIDHILQQNS